MGWLSAVFLSNIIFTIYHFGAWPFTVYTVLEFFLVGSMLGFIYYGTGSLGLAVIVHSLYDALCTVTPLIEHPLPQAVGSLMQAAAFILLALWAWKGSSPNKSPQPTGSAGG